MAIVKQDFTEEDGDEEIPDNDLRGGQDGIHAVGNGDNTEFVDCGELDYV